MVVFGIVAFVGALASTAPFSDAETGPVALAPLSCSVQGVDGGIQLTWGNVPGADGYTYKVDRAGAPSVYATVDASPVFIPVASADRVTVAMAPIADGEPAHTRTPCGAAMPTEPAISHELRCTITRDDDGLVVVWNDVDGIASYGLKVDFDDHDNAVYRRTTSTRTRLQVDLDQTVSIGVAPVFADGSTLPRVDCVDSSA